MKFTGEMLRVAENIGMTYRRWMDSERAAADIPGRLTWKTVSGKQYLYRIRNGRGQGTSLGPRSAETEALYARYENHEQVLKATKPALEEQCALYRALGLPMIQAEAGNVLREFDRRGMLGTSGLIVVGTNTMAAYEIAAGERFAQGVDATQDIDFAWFARDPLVLAAGDSPAPIMDALKAVDGAYTVNLERRFQARNAAGYEVELLAAPSRMGVYPKTEGLRPVPDMVEQEWLLLGRPVDEVVVDRSRQACRIVAPDPRWMALHKLWVADKPARNPKKKDKDRQQGERLLSLVERAMPHYRIDDDFIRTVPDELRRYLPRQAT